MIRLCLAALLASAAACTPPGTALTDADVRTLGTATLGLAPYDGALETPLDGVNALWAATLGDARGPVPHVDYYYVSGAPSWDDDARWAALVARTDSALGAKGWERTPEGEAGGSVNAWQGAGQRLALGRVAFPGDSTGYVVLLGVGDRAR